VLACLTVDMTTGNVLHICNFHCRRHAGSFPSLTHWLSLVPIVPLIKFALERMCCGDQPFKDFINAWRVAQPSGVGRVAAVTQVGGLVGSAERALAMLMGQTWGSLIAGKAGGLFPSRQPAPPPVAPTPARRRQRPPRRQ